MLASNPRKLMVYSLYIIFLLTVGFAEKCKFQALVLQDTPGLPTALSKLRLCIWGFWIGSFISKLLLFKNNLGNEKLGRE